MGLKQCDKCEEMVDEAKAFCPGCGHSFVEEQKRREESSFDKMDSTVQFGQTMYNQMLSDMGLNISKPAKSAEKSAEKRIEVILPAAAPAVHPAPAKPPEIKQEKPETASNTKWFILGGIIIVLFFLLVLIAAVLVFIYWSRFR